MPTFINKASVQRAANILGTTEAELTRIIFTPSSLNKPRQTSEKARSDSTLSNSSEQGNETDGNMYQDALDGLVMGLYVETFSALIRLINR